MPVPSYYCHAMSSLPAMWPIPLIWSVMKFLKIVSLFIHILFFPHSFIRLSLICSYSTSHMQTSSFAFRSGPTTSSNQSTSSFSPSESATSSSFGLTASSPPLVSLLLPSTSIGDWLGTSATSSNAGHNDGKGAGKKPYEEGRLEDSTRDGASDGI